MTRNLRRLAAVLALFGLASAQAALAAYICPIDAGKAPASAVSEHAQCGPQSDPAIDGALCELHCQVTSSVPSSPAADLVVPAAAPLVVAGRSVHAPQSYASPRPVRPDALAAAPPAVIRYCRLLI